MKNKRILYLVPLGLLVVVAAFYSGKYLKSTEEAQRAAKTDASPSNIQKQGPTNTNKASQSSQKSGQTAQEKLNEMLKDPETRARIEQQRKERQQQYNDPQYWVGFREKKRQQLGKYYANHLVTAGLLTPEENNRFIELMTEKGLEHKAFIVQQYGEGRFAPEPDEYKTFQEESAKKYEELVKTLYGDEKAKLVTHFQETLPARLQMNQMLANSPDQFTQEQIDLFIEVLTDINKETPIAGTTAGVDIQAKKFMEKAKELLSDAEYRKIAPLFQARIDNDKVLIPPRLLQQR